MRDKDIDLSFRVDPAELDTFVEGVSRLRGAMDRHVQTYESLTLRKGEFGRLPGISSKIHDAYAHHVEEGTKAFAEGRAVLEATADRASETAAEYRQVEQDNLALVAELAEQIPLPTKAGAVTGGPAPARVRTDREMTR
ncbi:MAG TPA: hypothetical protein IAA98_01170 [Candidatus Avipropionibacterium avicola]|uniref:Uncharacterized protein n=1 Tax=Candidatus Avipropionibacterium avicola TaxID=2840701 RepID=A0A9D1GWN3_9ACTN|nr:hypothetical protein [Candidatus Avipropionibacterium avicola]